MDSQEEIETIFKVEPPLISLEEKNQFGFLGVLLRNKVLDKVQCHLCGEWFDSLSAHIVNGYKMKTEEYRRQFQLPLHYPLCSKTYSERSRKTYLDGVAKRNKLTKNGMTKSQRKKAIKKLVAKATSSNGFKNHFYSYNNLSWKNRHGTCDEQLMKRFLVIADNVGHEPTKTEIEGYDGGLYSLIIRRHGSLNNFRKISGYKVNKNPDEVKDIQIIGSLRKFCKVHKKLPKQIDFYKGTPNARTILRRFKSWTRALNHAGLLD